MLGKDEEQYKNIIKLKSDQEDHEDKTRMRIRMRLLLLQLIYQISEITDGYKNVANSDGKEEEDYAQTH